jgi:hypothetical protein
MIQMSHTPSRRRVAMAVVAVLMAMSALPAQAQHYSRGGGGHHGGAAAAVVAG